MNVLTKIPEHLRGWAYLGLFVVALALGVSLIVVDVLQGADPGEWVAYVLGFIGLSSSGLAAANTSRR